MGSFLTALANVGSQYAEGREEARKEKTATAEKQAGLDIQKQYLDIARQNAQRQQEELEFRKKQGDVIELKDGRLWSISQGKLIDVPPAASSVQSMNALKELIKNPRYTADQQREMSLSAQAELEGNPNNTAGAVKAVLAQASRIDQEQRAEERYNRELRERQAGTQEAQKERERFQREQTGERQDFMRQQAAANRQFQQYMVDVRLNEKAKFMTTQERQQWESIKTVEPMINRLSNFIERNNLQDENNYIFGDRSALMQHLRMRGYKFGVAQEPATQELIKDAAAISIMGAAPWVRIGRGKYTLEQIQVHLPKATDTPKNLYDKTTWLRDNVITDAKDSLANLVPPGGETASPSAAPAAPDSNNPLGINLTPSAPPK